MTTSTEGQTPAPLARRVLGDRSGRIGTPTRPLRQRLRMPLMIAGPAVVAVDVPRPQLPATASPVRSDD